MKIHVKKLTKTAIIPTRGTPDSAGMDFYSDENVMLKPGEFKFVESGVSLAIPRGFFMYIRPRSGKATKQGLNLRSSNIIDSDYRGEIKLCCYNLSDKNLSIEAGERIAQGVILPVYDVEFEEVEELEKTHRDSGGFGSTG